MSRRCDECIKTKTCTLDKSATDCYEFQLCRESEINFSYVKRSTIEIWDGINPKNKRKETLVVTKINGEPDYKDYPEDTKFVLMPIRGIIREEEHDSRGNEV